MACPFGYKASGADSGSNVAPEIPKGHPPAPAGSAGRCPMMSNRSNEDDKRFNFDDDPVSWFYQNQIKSEEEFQATKTNRLFKIHPRRIPRRLISLGAPIHKFDYYWFQIFCRRLKIEQGIVSSERRIHLRSPEIL
jgi:hypothetical protein